MTTTSYPGSYFHRDPGPRLDARRVVRLPTGPHQEPQPSAGSAFREAGMGWVALSCVLGFVVSYLLGSLVSAMDLKQVTVVTTQSAAASSAKAFDAEPHHATFHEPFNLHPTRGDVEDPPVTF